jgi:hypothetical protein
MHKTVWFVTALLLGATAFAQTLAQPEIGTRLVNLPTHLGPGASTFEVLFTHRFTQTVSDAGGYDLFGFDSAADIGIGLGMGFGHGLSAEIYRSSFFKQWESALKWTAIRQGDTFPAGLTVRAGADYRGASGVVDRWSGFVQVIGAYRLGGALDFFLVPSYASDTPTLHNAFNVGAGAAYHLPGKWDLAAEVVAKNQDARNGEMAWCVALQKRLPGHSFLLYLGNSRATMTDLIVGSDFPGGFDKGDVRVGFNLSRRFPE